MRSFFTARGINGAINIGIGTSLVPCITNLILAFLIEANTFNIIESIVVILMWLGLGFGIAKKSRICACLALSVYIVDQLFLISDIGYTRFNLLWIFFIFGFSYAIIGTRLYHKMIKEGSDLSSRLVRESLILFIIVSAVFYGCFPLAIKQHDNIMEKAWQQYMQRVEVRKEKLNLPIRIDKDIYFRDIYFEDKTLVFEYDTKNLKQLQITEWYNKTRQDFSQFCSGTFVQFSKLRVIYRFTQGYDKREFNYGARDCQLKP